MTSKVKAEVAINMDAPTRARLQGVLCQAQTTGRVDVAQQEIEALIVSVAMRSFSVGIDTALDVATDVRLDERVQVDDEGVEIFRRIEALRDASADQQESAPIGG